MNCTFCSTDAGTVSKYHKTNFVIEVDYLLKWLEEIAKFKGDNLIAHIDGVGDPSTYQDLLKLIQGIKKIENFSEIALQTNAHLLNKELIQNLKKAGLNKIHTSVHSLNENSSKELFGNESYNINHIKDICKEIVNNEIELWINPVLLPKTNEEDIKEIIKFVKELKCNIGIQKYEIHKYGRKLKQKQSWFHFYQQLKEFEKEHNLKLIHNNVNFPKRNGIPIEFKKNEKTFATIKAPGWIRGQMLGTSKNRCISIINCNNSINDTVKVKILENKNNIYLAEKIQ
jgi:uncharacterized Fe-S cluster-containing radical SAM superfamily enzyme